MCDDSDVGEENLQTRQKTLPKDGRRIFLNSTNASFSTRTIGPFMRLRIGLVLTSGGWWLVRSKRNLPNSFAPNTELTRVPAKLQPRSPHRKTLKLLSQEWEPTVFIVKREESVNLVVFLPLHPLPTSYLIVHVVQCGRISLIL